LIVKERFPEAFRERDLDEGILFREDYWFIILL
jgi:hypothetical protein